MTVFIHCQGTWSVMRDDVAPSAIGPSGRDATTHPPEGRAAL